MIKSKNKTAIIIYKNWTSIPIYKTKFKLNQYNSWSTKDNHPIYTNNFNLK